MHLAETQDDNDAMTRPWDDDTTMTWDEYDTNDVSTTMQKKDTTSTWDNERTTTMPPLYLIWLSMPTDHHQLFDVARQQSIWPCHLGAKNDLSALVATTFYD